MTRAVSKCPQCGELVSQFAAGCAICGANLEAARRKAAQERRLPAPDVPRFRTADTGDAFTVFVMAVVSLFAPPFGLLLGLFLAYRFDSEGRSVMRNLALLCAAGVASLSVRGLGADPGLIAALRVSVSATPAGVILPRQK